MTVDSDVVNIREAQRKADDLRSWIDSSYEDSGQRMRGVLRVPTSEAPHINGEFDYVSDIFTKLDTIVDAAMREAYRTRGIRPSVRHLRSTG